MSDPKQFSIREGSAAVRLGVSRRALRALRKEHLSQGEHWSKQAGGTIQYSEAGLALLARKTALPAPAPAEPPPPPGLDPKPPCEPPSEAAEPISSAHTPDEPPAAFSPGKIDWFHVERTFEHGNRGVIHARPRGSDRRVTVRIRASACAMYKPGMEFAARWVGPDMAECERQPRQIGRW